MPPRVPPYPLGVVIDQLRARREVHQGALAGALRDAGRARSDLDAALNRRGASQARLDAAQAALSTAAADGLNAAELQHHWSFTQAHRASLARSEAGIADGQAALERARIRVGEARARLTDADRQMKLQEKHRENWLGRQRAERGRREQNQEAEIGRMLHQRRRRNP